MNRIPFIQALTLGQMAACYHRDRETFKKMIGPLIEGKLSYLKDGRIRTIIPADQKLIAEFLGDTEYRASFPKLTLASIACCYGWTDGQMNRNIRSIRAELINAGFIPRRALTPFLAQMIFNHLGVPEHDNDPLLRFFKFS